VVAFRQVGLSGVDAEKLAGDLSKVTLTHSKQWGGRLAARRPRHSRPHAWNHFDWDLKPATQSYNNRIPGASSLGLTGEQVSFTLRSGLEILAGDMWSTKFRAPSVGAPARFAVA